MRQRFLESHVFLLKGLCTDLLGLVLLGAQVLGQQHERLIRDTWGETELSGFGVMAERPAFSQTNAGRDCCCFAEPFPPYRWHVGTISESPSTWLMLFTLPWRLPEAQTHPTCRPMQAISSGFSMQTACLGSFFRLS